MKDNKQKGLASLFITVVVLVFFGFLAYNVLSAGKGNTGAVATSETTISNESGKVTGDEATDSDVADETGKTSKFSTGKIKLGLDLAGGVSITYQTVEPNPSDEDMADTIYKLQQRVQNYSTEAEVYREVAIELILTSRVYLMQMQYLTNLESLVH